MKPVSRMHRALKKLPPAAAVVLGFGTLIGLGIVLVLVLPPTKDANQQCVDQCSPRTAQLVADKDYPMGKTGYRSKCVCS
jgi:hypothetical protein